MNQYALALSLVSGFLAFPQSPTIKIRIDDPPRISAEILRKAEKEAGALMESGGIKVIWRDCSKAGGCEHQFAADELILHLLAPSRQTNQERTQDYGLATFRCKKEQFEGGFLGSGLGECCSNTEL